MEAIEMILDSIGCERRAEPLKVSDEDFAQIIHRKLPSDYRLFLEYYPGYEGMIGPEYVQLWEFEALLEMNIGYEIGRCLPKTLGIGTNGGGELIAMECIENEGFRIVLTPLAGLDPQNHLEIRSSFSDFLGRLDDGVEWFG